MLPARTAVLNHLYKVNESSIEEIMEVLKPHYGSEGQFTYDMFLEHVLSLEANGLVEMVNYSLGKNDKLVLIYKINDDGRATVEKYVPSKYR